MLYTNAAKCCFFGHFKRLLLFLPRAFGKKARKKRSNSSKNELAPSNRKVMHQGNMYIVLEKFEMLDEEHAGSKTHTKEEQVSARNPNYAILPDKKNNEAVQRWSPKKEEYAKYGVRLILQHILDMAIF